MTVIALRSGDMRARITTHGGSILRLDQGAVPLLRPADDDALPIDSACYPLVPFGNRVRGNRFTFQDKAYTLAPNTDWDAHYLHGEGWRSDWRVVNRQEDRLVLSHEHDGSSMPWIYSAEQRFNLRPDMIELEISVTNRGNEAMPFGLGWHPYFPMTPQTTLHTRTGRMWTEEAGWLPGKAVDLPQDLDFSAPKGLPDHWVNNGFEDWSGEARIDWPERGRALRVEAAPLFRVMFLFVSSTSFDPSYRRDFFALEPMSHLADGHNMPDLGGLAPLAPGESLSGSLRLKVEHS
ncbi:MAG TPA: aldose 1-epimerase [Mesorhizobium sp.]